MNERKRKADDGISIHSDAKSAHGNRHNPSQKKRRNENEKTFRKEKGFQGINKNKTWRRTTATATKNADHDNSMNEPTSAPPSKVGHEGESTTSFQYQPKKKVEVNAIEDCPKRLAARQRQIDLGKNTLGYQKYLEQVPREKRSREHPSTPDLYQKMSKRCFDGLLRQWRRKLHQWDPEVEQDQVVIHEPPEPDQSSVSKEDESAARDPIVSADDPSKNANDSAEAKNEKSIFDDFEADDLL